MRQMLTDIKGEINSNTIIVGEFNTSLSSTDRSSRQKINKETQVLNDTLDQMDLIAIFRALSKSNRVYIPFKYTWNILQD